MAQRWLDDWQEIEARRRFARRLLQVLARSVFQIWQKRRIAALRARVLRQRGALPSLSELAARLGWDQTRAYEAERDFGDCQDDPDVASLRLWPRLRSLDELAALELLELELAGDAIGPDSVSLDRFYAAALDHFAAINPGGLRVQIHAALGPAADDALLAAILAWLTDQRKAREVREIASERLAASLPAAIAVLHRLGMEHYEEIVRECAVP